MSIYDSLGNGRGGAANMQANPQQMLSQLKSDPASVLKMRGFNIPAGMTNPQQIVQHLVQSGQVPQSRYLQAMQMLGQR